MPQIIIIDDMVAMTDMIEITLMLKGFPILEKGQFKFFAEIDQIVKDCMRKTGN